MNRVAGLVLTLGIALAPGAAPAQDAWPNRPITLVVPYAPGGYTDLVARLTARYVEKALGKSVVVDNRAGAGGIVGTQAVATAPPDGYTWCICSIGAISIAPFAQKVAYDPVQDLAPVGIVSSIVQAVIVKKDLPVKTMGELVSHAKANPGKLNFASAGVGTGIHMAGEQFKMMAGVNMVHVPYRGAGNAMTDLIGGQVQLMFDTMAASIPHIRGGKVRALAVTTATRSTLLPELPTVADFVPGYEASGPFGLGAPKDTPPAIIEKLNREINAVLADPKVKARLADLGSEPLTGSPAEIGRMLAGETEKWAKVIRAANIKVE
jgi:tripartite-type tricarboxylate transporter receptor subunit TctC